MRNPFAEKALHVFTALLLAAAISIAAAPASAQQNVPTMSPDLCANVQAQVDQVVALGADPSLSDEEKIARLSKSWAGSFQSLLKSSKKDADVAGQVKSMANPVQQMIAQALSGARSGEKNAAPEMESRLRQLKQQVEPFMALMKVLCPNLKLPAAVNK